MNEREARLKEGVPWLEAHYKCTCDHETTRPAEFTGHTSVCTIHKRAVLSTRDLSVMEAAIKSEVDGKVWSVPQPGRHCDVIQVMVAAGYPTPINRVMGFVLSNGMFTWRVPAKAIARRAGQLLPRACEMKELYSEDVW